MRRKQRRGGESGARRRVRDGMAMGSGRVLMGPPRVGVEGVGDVASGPPPELGRWAGLLGESGSLGGRLADVLGGEEGPEAQATATAALRRLFRFWSSGGRCWPNTSQHVPKHWVKSAAFPGLLWLAGDRSVSQATRATALEALAMGHRLDWGGAHELLTEQLKALRVAALSAALHPDEPFHEELLHSAVDLMPGWDYLPPKALQPSLVSALRHIRLGHHGPRVCRMGMCLWEAASLILYRLARKSGDVLSVEGAMRELLCSLDAADPHYGHSRYLVSGLAPSALGGFIAGGGAAWVVGALRWALDHLFPVGATYSGKALGTVGQVVEALWELFRPSLVGPAAVLTRARLLEDAGLDALLPRLRRFGGQDPSKIDALLQRYDSALHPFPALSRLPTSIVFYQD